VSSTEQDEADSQAFYSSLVMEHIVAISEIAAFDRWQQDLEAVAGQHAGFVRLDQAPELICDNDVVKRYTIIHFDSPAHLKHWIDSKDRQAITRRGRQIFRAYRYKSFTTGLEGWFSRRTASGENSNLGPPVWKQILSVVLGLYPLIMLRLKFVPDSAFLPTWPNTMVTLLTTLVTSSLLAVFVMPLITRWLSFWLYPAYRKSTTSADLIGLAIVWIGLMTMAILFEQV